MGTVMALPVPVFGDQFKFFSREQRKERRWGSEGRRKRRHYSFLYRHVGCRPVPAGLGAIH